MPTGSMSGPPEETRQTCDENCDMTLDETAYKCDAKGCKKDNLCVGCVYVCADCSGDFCFGHVTDVNDDTHADARYVCRQCIALVMIFEEIAA